MATLTGLWKGIKDFAIFDYLSTAGGELKFMSLSAVVVVKVQQKATHSAPTLNKIRLALLVMHEIIGPSFWVQLGPQERLSESQFPVL